MHHAASRSWDSRAVLFSQCVVMGVEMVSKLGRASAVGGRAPETKKKSDEQLLKVIAEGTGKMPASRLTKEEQKQTLGYIRSLAK